MTHYMRVVVLLALLLGVSQAGAHGMKKPGPHGGVIDMPGPFHTEIVQGEGAKFEIYLLDMNFKNPILGNSWVDFVYEGPIGAVGVQCVARKDYFECRLPEKSDLKKGFIKVKASRNGVQGNEVQHSLPLKVTHVKKRKSTGTK